MIYPIWKNLLTLRDRTSNINGVKREQQPERNPKMTTQQLDQLNAIIDQLDNLRDDVPDAEWAFMSDALSILSNLYNWAIEGTVEEELLKFAE